MLRKVEILPKEALLFLSSTCRTKRQSSLICACPKKISVTINYSNLLPTVICLPPWITYVLLSLQQCTYVIARLQSRSETRIPPAIVSSFIICTPVILVVYVEFNSTAWVHAQKNTCMFSDRRSSGTFMHSTVWTYRLPVCAVRLSGTYFCPRSCCMWMDNVFAFTLVFNVFRMR